MSGSEDLGARPQVKCLACSLSRLCLPASLSADEVDKLEHIVRRNRPLKKGEYLFKADEPMDHVFALRSGAIKNFLLDAEGNERVSGFILPGEMLGLDAIGASHYRSSPWRWTYRWSARSSSINWLTCRGRFQACATSCCTCSAWGSRARMNTCAAAMGVPTSALRYSCWACRLGITSEAYVPTCSDCPCPEATLPITWI